MVGRRLAPVLVAAIVACGSDAGTPDDGEIVASVDFEVTPAEIALGDVSCGSTLDASITITNRGGATLEYNVALPDGSPFKLAAEPKGTIAAGASASIPIRIAPEVTGDVADLASVDINGIIQQVPLRARGVGATLVVDPSSLDFGEVRFDRAFTKDVVVRNDGNAPALVEGFDGAADAIDVGPNGTMLAPGAVATFTATIGAGAVTGAQTTASLTPRLAASTAHCGARPKLDVKALRVNTDVTLSVADFGQQPCGVGAGATRDVTITNYALQQLTYTATLPAGSVFTIASGGTGTVAAATPSTPTTAAVKIAIGATGTVLGVREESLGIQIDPLPAPSGGARTTKMRLDVRGAIINVSPGQASFTADDKKADKETFRFENTGNEAVKLKYAIDARSNSSAWSIDTTSQDFAPAQSHDVNVFFKAIKNGPDRYDATLKVSRESGAAICNALPQPKLTGNKK